MTVGEAQWAYFLPAAGATALAALLPVVITREWKAFAIATCMAIFISGIFALLGCLGIYLAWLRLLRGAPAVRVKVSSLRWGAVFSVFCWTGALYALATLDSVVTPIAPETSLVVLVLPVLCGFITATTILKRAAR